MALLNRETSVPKRAKYFRRAISNVRHGLARARSAKQRTAGFRPRTAISAHIHDERELCTIEEIKLIQLLLIEQFLKNTFSRWWYWRTNRRRV
jgi:hypothetical protein